MRPEARLERARAWMLARERGDGDRRHVPRIERARDLTHQPVAVLAGHRDIADDRVGARAEECFETTLRRLRHDHPRPAHLEHRSYHVARVVVVLDDEHGGAFELHRRSLYTSCVETRYGKVLPTKSGHEEK